MIEIEMKLNNFNRFIPIHSDSIQIQMECKLNIFKRFLFPFFRFAVGSIETCTHLYTDSICMSRRSMDDKIIFLYIDFVPIDVGGNDWYSKVLGLSIYTERAKNFG